MDPASPQVGGSDGWCWDDLGEEVTRVVMMKGIEVESLRLPENIDEETDYQAFCPRCFCLYMQQEGTGGDCANTKLVPLSDQWKKVEGIRRARRPNQR